MKKVISILAVLVVLVGAVFAEATSNSIELKSTVGQVKPGFVIFSGSVIGTAAGAELDTNKDLSEADITVTFSLKQSGNENSKTYSRYKGGITLSVEINPFANTTVGGTQSTAYEITSSTKGTGVANRLTLADPSIANDKHSVTFGLTYAGKKVDNTDAESLGTFTAKWTKDPDLPMDGASTIYTSDVVLSYTVN